MELIAAAGAGGLTLILFVLLLVTRRGRRRARARTGRLGRDLESARAARQTATAGEREAVWALGEASSALERAAAQRDDAYARLAALEGDLDDLRHGLRDADADVAAARREADEAQTEISRLESTLAAAAHDTGTRAAEASSELKSRLEVLVADLQRERATVARLRSELETASQTEHDDSYRDRLVASEARRRDLEDRLASLNSVRSAEQRSSAERIAGLERLHLQIGEREERIDELEVELKQAEESRDEALQEASRLQVELVRLKGELAEATRRLRALEEQSTALTAARARITELEERVAATTTQQAELERLRKSLDAERSRAERIARRATETAPDTTYAMWDRVVRERVDAAVARESARLREQVDHLRTVVAEKEARLRAVSGGLSEREHLDLPPITAIRGIGRRIAGILADHGIATVADVADLTDEELEGLAGEMPIYPRRIWDDDWRGQALRFVDRARNPEPEPEPPAGPPPLTAIKGIGPKIAAILHKNGISSVDQIAALTENEIDELAGRMPVYPGRIRDDDWVGQAQSFL